MQFIWQIQIILKMSQQQQPAISAPNQATSDVGAYQQSAMEVQELLLQELENLFDRPCLIPVPPPPSGKTEGSGVATPFKVGLEKDYSNTSLITNPMAIFRVFNKEQFLSLPESTQGVLLDRLDDILLKCSHNVLILTDHIVQANITQIIRLSQTAIFRLKSKQQRRRTSSIEENKLQKQSPSKLNNQVPNLNEVDLLHLITHLGLKMSTKNGNISKKLVDLVKKLTTGKRFFRCHVEFIYQYLKVKCAEECVKGRPERAKAKVDTALKMLQTMFEQRFEVGPSNYFYFSGYLSGIQVNTKNLPQIEFTKGFSAAMWFQIQDNQVQDDKNLPVLFNCFISGFGGFECYFNQRKLLYRILPKQYSPPTIESNGVQIGEFTPNKWYFFAIEHERPFMTRPQFTAIINDKQVVSLPMDYPKFEKNAKISMIVVCQNFVGQLSSFMLFKEPIGNFKQLIHLGHQQYEFGIYSNQQLKNLKLDAKADAKMMEKLLVFYTPERTNNKTVYDCIELRDGELMINSGVCNVGTKTKLFQAGGLNSLLPVLELLKSITFFQNETVPLADLDCTINDYLKLVMNALQSRCFTPYEVENENFFSVMFFLLTKLPYSAVNKQTIQYLADVRFLIGESNRLQEQFFKSLMMSCDFWINTHNIEVIDEFWDFVKNIYQQNPVHFNRVFNIQNLIDLMIKISDIKDGHCCEFHKETFQMFYQGVQSRPILKQPTSNQWVFVDQQTPEQDTDDMAMIGRPSIGVNFNEINRSDNPFNTQQSHNDAYEVKMDGRIHNIERYLGPIAGVLEKVLTSGGNEVLDQIQYIAKSLAIKSSPCFHLQMLKLLKVLLLDSKEDRHCASPGDFALYFLKSNGLQILLYLCSNSSFDVKSMCVKLIDVLSSHSSMIKIAIDPDVLTYLCSIILPKQMMDTAAAHLSRKNQIFEVPQQNNVAAMLTSNFEGAPRVQYKVMSDEEENDEMKDIMEGKNSDQQFEDSQELENQMNQLLAKQPPVIQKKKDKKLNFGDGLFLEEQEASPLNKQENFDDEAQFIKDPKTKNLQFQIDQNKDIDEEELISALQNDNYKPQDVQVSDLFKVDEDDDLILTAKPPPPAPKNKSGAQMKFDFDSEESETIELPPKKQRNFFFGKQKNSTIAELVDEEDEDDNSEMIVDNFKDHKSEDEELIFPHQSEFQQTKKLFMNTQKIPSTKAKNKNTGKMPAFKPKLNLALEIDEDKGIGSARGFKPSLRPSIDIKSKPKNLGLQLDDEDDKSEDNQPTFMPVKKFGNTFNLAANKTKGDDPNNFSNENVMSKSNLRQPKSFNFGFPESDEDDSDQGIDKKQQVDIEQNQDLENFVNAEINIPKNPRAPSRPTLNSLTLNDPETQEQSPFKAKQEQLIGGTTGATFDDFITERTQEDINEEEQTALISGQVEQSTEGMTEFLEESKEEQKQQIIEEENEFQLMPAQKRATKKQAVISYQKRDKLFTNANLKLNIDTDAINELFNYGGEQGKIMMTEDEEQRQFEAEIEELASMCIAAMNRKRHTDPIKYENKRQKTTFESKYLKNESDSMGKAQKSKNPRQQFMTPQSVRGIKKIEFSLSQEEKNAALESSKEQVNLGASFGESSADGSKNFSGLKSGMFTSNTILEEMEANDSSVGEGSNQSSSHNKQSTGDINFPGLLSGSLGEPFKAEEKDENTISSNAKIEDELPRQSDPNSQITLANVQFNENQTMEGKGSVQIDQNYNPFSMTLNEDHYTKELENLYTSCLEWIISRAPSSLNENIVIDECDKVGYQPAIQLLLTLVTYSNNNIRQKALTDLLMLSSMESTNGVQIMMHPQFHSWLLELLMPYQDLNSKYHQISDQAQAVYDIGCKLHTLLLKNACISADEDAYKKINFVARWPSTVYEQAQRGIKDRQEQDVEVAHKLSRVLLTQLLNGLRDETSKQRPQIGKNSTSPLWHNIVYISYLVEEMILGSHPKEAIIEGIHSELGRDFSGQPLFKWIHDEGYLLYYNGSNEKSLWAEWDILESIFGTIDSLYPDKTTKQLSNANQASSQSIDVQIFNLLEKVSQVEDFNQIVEIMIQDHTPYKASQNQLQSTPPSKPAKKGILGNVFGSHLKLSSKEKDQNLQQQEQQHQMKSNEQQSFMWNIMNMLCIALTQSDSKELVTLWLERFERFTKFLMIISESWKSRLVTTLYNQYQKKFIDVLTFAFAFLFHEIHAKNRGSPLNSQTLLSGTSTSSPKDQMLFNKLYAQSLKSIMIFFINIIEYSKMKQTPSYLETHQSACRYIFNHVLVKSYTQTQQQENLISHKDITRFKQTDYEDFPECFYLEEWKVTFFYNETIRRVVKSHLSLEQLQSYQAKRKAFAVHQCETQSSNDKTKEDILRRMQYDTIEVIGTLSEEEFERKNRVALLNDNFLREQGNHWKHLKRQQVSGIGLWKSDPTRLKMTWYRLADGTRPIMEDCFGPSRFHYFKNEHDLERKIFEQPPHSQPLDLLLFDTTNTHHNNMLFQHSNSMGPQKLFPSTVNENTNNKLTDEDFDLEDEHSPGSNIIKRQHTSEPMIPLKTRISLLQQNYAAIHQQNLQFFSRMLTEREKMALKKQYIPILKEQIYTQRQHLQSGVKFKEIISEMRCEILKPFYKRVGYVTLTSHEVIFFEEMYNHVASAANNDSQSSDNIFFFKHTLPTDSLYYKILPLSDLRELQRRRWLGRKTALEVFLMNGKALLLNFPTTEDREQFAKKVLRQRNSRCSNLKYYDTLDPRRILKKRELTERWMQWKLSNFEYVTLLNQLSGRSYNDLSQYPVFPWLLSDFQTQQAPEMNAPFNQTIGIPPAGFRDLNKNMQLLGSAERQAEFKRKYEDPDSFENASERFHCGSHYSNPGIVLHYLSRVSPYVDACVQLHGRGLDTPDRCFTSIQASLQSALTDHADVRELIPEFYYCPELFLNQNRINFGSKQDGELVNDVQLPPWCQNDPYMFVIYMRESFESAYVSANLGGWIDYVFGCKQRDLDAERSLNTFSRLTYEDAVDLDAISDPLIKKGYQEQIYNYGQTPTQLFQKGQKHPPRLPRVQAMKFNTVVDLMAKIKVYKPVLTQQKAGSGAGAPQVQGNIITPEAILRAKFVDEQTIVGISKDGTATYFFWLSKAHELNPNTPFTLCEDKKRKFDHKTRSGFIDHYDRSIRKFEFPFLIMTNGPVKCVLRGGFWGGKILICPIEGTTGNSAASQQQADTQVMGGGIHGHSSTVTAMAATKDERVVISGSKSGEVIVWAWQADMAVTSNPQQGLHVRKQRCDHEAMVSFIYISEDMGMYLTSSFDGSASLYNLHSDVHLRTFHHPQLAPLHSALLTSTPLPAMCMFSRDDHHWYSYSLNNPYHLLEKQREDSCSHIIAPLVLKDAHSMDRLVYGTEKGYLVFRSLPLLKQLKKQQVSQRHPVLSLCCSPDRRFLMIGCGDGGLNVVTEPYNVAPPPQSIQNNTSIQQQNSTQTFMTSNTMGQSMISTQGRASNAMNATYRE